MRRIFRFMLVPIILAHIVLVFSCSDSEHRIPFGSARVVINLNLPPETPDAQAGLIERVRRFLVPDAVAQSAPAAFSSIIVRVTGPDIALIEKSFAPYATISLSVPAGALRIFEVTAYVAPGDPSAAASFQGTSSANCPAGATVNVPVVMGLNETKLVIPDFQNGRLVMINNMQGDGWREYKDEGGLVLYPFSPYDIDFDNLGRIYIANNATGQGERVLRLSSFTSNRETLSNQDLEFGIRTVAVDRTRNILYFSDGDTIRKANLDGTNGTDLINTPPLIRFMKVGNDGMLYITSGEPVSRINKYNPFTQTNQSSDGGGYLQNPWGILVKGSYIYVANQFDLNPDRMIVQYTSDLQYVNGYGTRVTSENTGRGMFYGPRNFVAILNRKITIIDDAGATLDKLISMADMEGSLWSTYGSSGTGEGYFQFYDNTST